MSDEKLQLNKVCVILEIETNMLIEDATDAGIIKQDLIKAIGREKFGNFIKWITCFGYGGGKNVFGDDIIDYEKIFSERFGDRVLIFRNCKPESTSMFIGEVKDGDKG